MKEDFIVSYGEPNICPFCRSNNTDIIETTSSFIHKKVEKPEQPISTGMVRVTHYGNNGKDYNISRILCLDCGQISNSLPKETLKQYNDDKPYFEKFY